MPTTITAFNTFVASSLAASAEVNTNFSNLRGDMLPIDPSIAAADSTSSYDLGSSDYRFVNSYVNSIDLKGATTTGDSSLFISSSSTAPALNVNYGGSIAHGAIVGGGVGFTASGEAFALQTLTTSYITIAALTLQIKPQGGLIMLSIVHGDGGFTTDGYSLFGPQRDTASSGVDSWQFLWFRQTAGTGASGITSGLGAFQNIGDNVSDIEAFHMYGGFSTIDTTASSDTTWHYWFAMRKLIGTQHIIWKSLNVKFIAKEIF